MPFIRIDPEAFDELADELGVDEAQRPSGEFEYAAPADCGGPPPAAIDRPALADALRAAGAARLRVRYDGGHDEGFAHADAIDRGDGAWQPIDAAATAMATPTLAAAIRAAGAADPRRHGAGWPDDADDAAIVRLAIDELAESAAIALLGRGFGTGEYEIFGALTLDLSTGAIADDPAAPRPPER